MVSSADSSPVDTVSDEFKLLEEYLIKSHGHTHHLSFKVQICSPLPTPSPLTLYFRSKKSSVLSATAKKSVSSGHLTQKFKAVTADFSGTALESPTTAASSLKAFASPLQKPQSTATLLARAST